MQATQRASHARTHVGRELAVRRGQQEHLVLGPDAARAGLDELAADDLGGEPAHALQRIRDGGVALRVDRSEQLIGRLEIEAERCPEHLGGPGPGGRR
jgi:hypothetical protein